MLPDTNTLPWKHTLKFPDSLEFLDSVRLCYAIPSSGGALPACVGCGWDYSSVESVQRDGTLAGAAALPRPWPRAAAPAAPLLQLRGVSHLSVHMHSQLHESSQHVLTGCPEQTRLSNTGPQGNTPTIPTNCPQRLRPKDPCISSRKFEIQHKDAEDSSCHLSDLIFPKSARLFTSHCS